MKANYTHQFAGSLNIDSIDNTCLHMAGEKAHLFIGDYSADIKDYNNIEHTHCEHYLQQIFLALNILRKGGHSVFKQYSAFMPFTQSVIVALTKMFKRVIMHKPVSSKVTNCECYLVCIDFIGVSGGDMYVFRDRLCSFTVDPLPFDITEQHALTFAAINNIIFYPYLQAIDTCLNIYTILSEKLDENVWKQFKIVNKYNHTASTLQWISNYPIRQIKQKDKLRSKEVVTVYM